jgi:hypothetical protein
LRVTGSGAIRVSFIKAGPGGIGGNRDFTVVSTELSSAGAVTSIRSRLIAIGTYAWIWAGADDGNKQYVSYQVQSSGSDTCELTRFWQLRRP